MGGDFFEWLVERVEVGDCWLWQRCTAQGYGRATVNYKAWLAHRYVYTQLVGPIPEGLVLDHLCRVPGCVNPDHLEPVTQTENIRRGFSVPPPPRRRGFQKVCKRGHSLSDAYFYNGSQHCRPCAKGRARAQRQRQKVAA